MQARHRNESQYFEELAATTRKYILPFILKKHPLKAGADILEIGCGVGGNLKAFLDMGCRVTGVDISISRITAAKQLLNEENTPEVRLSCSDFLKTTPEDDRKYDFIFIHDVIEHISDKDGFFEHARKFLKPGGTIYFAFPAWQMPFGGHQQICKSKVVSHLPFIHVLPIPIYRTYLNLFEKNTQSINELIDIKRCKTSIEYFKRLCKRHNYTILEEQLYFINPHYETKFGLKPRKLSPLIAKIPYIRNYFSTSCFYLVKPE